MISSNDMCHNGVKWKKEEKCKNEPFEEIALFHDRLE